MRPNKSLVRHDAARVAVVPEQMDKTGCSASRTLLRRAPLVTVGCEALGTKPPRPSGRQRKRERRLLLPAPGG